jgi:hypothetical protein
VPEVGPNGTQIDTERQARKYLDEQKAESKPKAVVAELDFDDDQDADGGDPRVTSGDLAGMEPDPVGVVSEPTTCESYTTRLVEWTRKQFCNIDGLTWGHAMSVWARLSGLSADQLDAM